VGQEQIPDGMTHGDVLGWIKILQDDFLAEREVEYLEATNRVVDVLVKRNMRERSFCPGCGLIFMLMLLSLLPGASTPLRIVFEFTKKASGRITLPNRLLSIRAVGCGMS